MLSPFLLNSKPFVQSEKFHLSKLTHTDTNFSQGPSTIHPSRSYNNFSPLLGLYILPQISFVYFNLLMEEYFHFGSVVSFEESLCLNQFTKLTSLTSLASLTVCSTFPLNPEEEEERCFLQKYLNLPACNSHLLSHVSLSALHTCFNFLDQT